MEIMDSMHDSVEQVVEAIGIKQMEWRGICGDKEEFVSEVMWRSGIAIISS